jgi:hypothetical protein
MFHEDGLSAGPGAGADVGGGEPPPVKATVGIFGPFGGYVVCAWPGADTATASVHEIVN